MTRLAPVKATILDDDKFRLLAIPFGGPIPSPFHPRGVDLDGETFTERTDIKADWFDVRPVDWHHGHDALMGRTVIAKADNLVLEEDGYWVDVWLKHGENRVNLVKRLAERGAQLYGSSESVQSMVQKSSTGEILVWPYVRQTLSTSPQNTYSVLQSAKAVLDGTEPTDSFWAEWEIALRGISDDLTRTSVTGDAVAKAGRVLSSKNEKDLRDAIAALHAALERADAVVGRQTRAADDTADTTSDKPDTKE